MARVIPFKHSNFLFFLLFFIAFVPINGKNHQSIIEQTKIKIRNEKITHINFYYHDIFDGKNPTSVVVVQPQLNSKAFFGGIVMIDDPLTQGPQLSSKLVGRAQGFFAAAQQQELGVLMAINFVFIEGNYNGSTISILGRNVVSSKVREMSVIGGSGVFRFARGYVEARTFSFDAKTGNAVVEYNVYVLHY